jgi:hypothetical protein
MKNRFFNIFKRNVDCEVLPLVDNVMDLPLLSDGEKEDDRVLMDEISRPVGVLPSAEMLLLPHKLLVEVDEQTEKLCDLVTLFIDDNEHHFRRERDFFHKHVRKNLGLRYPSMSVHNIVEWEDVRKNYLIPLLMEHSQCFINDVEKPAFNSILSIKHCINNPQDIDIQWMGEMGFVDKRMLVKSWSGLHGAQVTFNMLADIDNIRADLSICHKQYKLHECLLILIDCFDPVARKMIYPQDWQARLDKREEKKVDMCGKYMASIQQVFTPRQLTRAYKINAYKYRDLSNRKMSISLWQDLALLSIRKHMRHPDARTASESLIKDQFRHSVIHEIASDFEKRVKEVPRRFDFKYTELQSLFSKALRHAIVSAKKHSLVFKPVRKVMLGELKRIEKMGLSRKSQQVYEDHSLMAGVCTLYKENSLSMFSVHRDLVDLGVNLSTIRNMMKALFPLDAFGTPRALHNLVESLHRFVGNFIQGNLKNRHSDGRLYNKVVQLVVSNIQGGQFNANILRELSSLGQYPHLTLEKARSLEHLIGACYQDDALMLSIVEQAKKKGLVVEERDSEFALTMRLMQALKRHIGSLPYCEAQADDVVLKDTVGRLTVEILPANHLSGVMGAGVSGVCIGFDSSYHREHIHPRCRNLVICDEDKIYLWGLLVQSDCGAYYLNNFQGSLPTRHNKLRQQLVLTVQGLLSQLGDIYMLDFYFNAMRLCEGLIEKENIALTLPPMRLDANQDMEGTITGTHFYHVPAMMTPLT